MGKIKVSKHQIKIKVSKEPNTATTGWVFLSLQRPGNVCHSVVLLDKELDLLEQAIRKYKRERAVETLNRFKEGRND